MIAKFAAILAIIGFANAGYLGGYSGYSGLGYSGLGYSGLGYSGHGYSGLGYGGLGYGGYSAPIVTKAVIPAVYHAPAISHVSSYQVHPAPIVKSYVAPVSYGGLYGGYGGYGYGGQGYGYGGHGYGSKYLW